MPVNPFVIQPDIYHPVIERPGVQDPGAMRARREIERRAHDAAKEAIGKAYKAHGGAFPIGVFGNHDGDLMKVMDGHYTQGFDWGKISYKTHGDTPVTTIELLLANISIAAVQCFGTDDDGGSDETYVLASVIKPADAFLHSTGISKTWRSPVKENTHAHDVILTNTMIQEFRDIPVGTAGLHMKIVMMDEEHGSPDQARAELKSWADAAAADYQNALTNGRVRGAAGRPEAPARSLPRQKRKL